MEGADTVCQIADIKINPLVRYTYCSSHNRQEVVLKHLSMFNDKLATVQTNRLGGVHHLLRLQPG